MSAQTYSRDMAKLSVAKMLQTIGWNSINTTPLEILTDILVQYLMQISRTANDYANEFGCTEPNLDHVGLAFRDCHVHLTELEEYVTFVDFAQPPVPVPKYPLYKEDNLNFLKPGSKECLTRPVHIHEHLPPISITEVDNDDEATAAVTTVNMEDNQQDCSAKDDSSDNVLFKRPAEVSPNENYKRIRMPSISEANGIGEPEQGRPTREISSVMMTTSGFISPAREGRLPDSRTPIVQGPTSEPPSPEQPSGSPPPASHQPSTSNSATDGQQALLASSEQPTDNAGEQVVVDVVKPDMPLDNITVDDLAAGPIVAGVLPTAGHPIVCAPSTPIMKRAKAPRKQDQQPRPRKEKLSFSGNIPGVHYPGQPEVALIPTPKPRKPSGQTNRDLARQMKKHQQQMMLMQQAQSAEMDQPMNLSTHQDVVTPDVQHAAKAKAKANRTLAAARRKTEKLNTTITPIPMPLAMKTDKLFNEPDKKKLNILKKISNYRNEGKPAALGKAPPPQPEEDDRVQQMLHSDVTIELVDIRNSQAAQHQAALAASAEVSPSTNIPVKEKRKRKERVPKPRKVPKIMPMSSPRAWEDVEVVEQPKTPEHVAPHGFPVSALNKMPGLGPNLPFPFLPQFSGPGLIPSFPNPLFPNHLLPAQFRAAAAINNILHHNPYLADAQQLNADQSDQQEIGAPFQQPRCGRQRKSPGQGGSGGADGRQLMLTPVVDSRSTLPPAFPGFVSSTTMSPQWHSDHNGAQHQPSASVQVSSSATVGSFSGVNREQSSAHSSPSNAVVGSTVILTPPSPAPVVAVVPPASVVSSPPPAAVPSTSAAAEAPIEQRDQPLPASVLKLDKKNREHKKDKKDKVKKKNKKDKVKKDKLEKKKLREELKLKLKKEKKEKKKDKDMMRGNISENVGTVPKLTLKLGSPPPKTGHQDGPSGTTDSAKLIVKPIILRKEDSSAADDTDKKRESSPELARILPLVTGLPKPKSTQPSTSSSSKDHHNHQHHQHAPHYMDSSVRNESAAVIVKTHHAGPGRPRKQPAPSPAGKQPTVQQLVQPHLEVGRVKVSRQLIAAKLFNKPHTLPADSHGNEVWICPHCGKQDDGSPMIGCDDCDAWYHWVCVNMQVPPEENEDWYCKNCIKKKMQSSLLPDKKKKRKKKDKKEH